MLQNCFAKSTYKNVHHTVHAGELALHKTSTQFRLKISHELLNKVYFPKFKLMCASGSNNSHLFSSTVITY